MRIPDPKYRRGHLLLNFLKESIPFFREAQYKNYLETFINEGEKFNGTNLWLSNLIQSDQKGEMVFFAHNQRNNTNYGVLDQEKFYAFGNGEADEEWEK